ncbi:MAG: hypothetical protein AAFY48_11225 [Bacteroidota bacterium]
MNSVQLTLLLSLNFVYLMLSAQTIDTLLTYYPGTEQRWEKVYTDGQKTAENIYYTSDAPWMTVQYDAQEREAWKWYYDNGQPYFQATIVDDQLQGRYRIWYEHGQVAEDLYFTDHIENGPAIFYHPNGQVAMQGQYLDGEMVGDWLFFDEDGLPPNGDWSWPFAASLEHIRVQGQFTNGLPSGTWTYWATANQGLASQKVFQRVYD